MMQSKLSNYAKSGFEKQLSIEIISIKVETTASLKLHIQRKTYGLSRKFSNDN